MCILSVAVCDSSQTTNLWPCTLIVPPSIKFTTATMASGGSSSGPDRIVGSENLNPCKTICLNVGLVDNPARQTLTDREMDVKGQFDKFSMVGPDLIMLQEVNEFWFAYVKPHAENVFKGCNIQRYAENNSVVILCDEGWGQLSPDRIVGGELQCFGDTDDEKKKKRKCQLVDATFMGGPVLTIPHI